jgi:phenylacetic acid degradation protein/carnitine operon protein CaiE
MIAWKTDGTRLYQKLPGEMMQYWKECEPLREAPGNIPQQEASYKIWSSLKKKI